MLCFISVYTIFDNDITFMLLFYQDILTMWSPSRQYRRLILRWIT